MTNSDAIRKDVSEEMVENASDATEESAKREDPVEQTDNVITDPRLEEMEKIAKKNRSDEKQVEVEEPEITAERPEEPPVFKDDGVWKTRTKVNGEEVVVPYDDVKMRYQKGTAADKRLEEAALRMRQVEAREVQLRQVQQQLEQQKQLSERDAARSVLSGKDAQKETGVKEVIDAIYSGEEEEAVNALGTLIGNIKGHGQERNESVTPDQIVNLVENRISERNAEIDRQNAILEFKKEFPEIAEDPRLWEIADRETIAVIQENPSANVHAIMEEAGKRTRAWMSKYEPQSANTAKAEKKRQSAGNVSGKNVRASLGEDEPPPMTASDIINEMRTARVS
mgnify:CR=1 FL=1